MIRKIVLPILLACISVAHAEEITLEDGRKIVLHEDGTWSFVSTDRLLGTADGRQVRVREDGTWEYTGALAPEPAAPSGAVEKAAAGEFIVALKELAIETATSKTHKGKHKTTQTVFTVSLLNTGAAASKLQLDRSAIAVEDSGGREYPVLQVSPESVAVDPGGKVLVEVRADGSPHWFTTKAMELHFAEGLLSATDEVVLKGLMSEAKKRELKQD